MRTTWNVSKKECPKCHGMIGATGHKKHVEACDGVDRRYKPSTSPKLPDGKTQAWHDAIAARRGHGTNQYTKAKRLGLPIPSLSEKQREASRQRNLLRSEEWHKENGAKISKTCLEKSARGEWHTSLAKKMHINYNGVDLHGKWELEYARYLDDNHFEWKRPKDRFAYEFEGKIRWYTPDFYLVATKEFVEIKGYETDKDRAKWSQFPGKLIVLRGIDLIDLGLDIKI